MRGDDKAVVFLYAVVLGIILVVSPSANPTLVHESLVPGIWVAMIVFSVLVVFNRLHL